MQDNFSFLDILAIYSVFLQVQNIRADEKEASNNVILKELQRIDREYLERILKNQNKILDLLAAKVD